LREQTNLASCDDLVRELEKLVASWRKKPSRSREYSERVRCSELIKAIENRFGRTYYIVATNHQPGDYQVCSDHPMLRQNESETT